MLYVRAGMEDTKKTRSSKPMIEAHMNLEAEHAQGLHSPAPGSLYIYIYIYLPV